MRVDDLLAEDTPRDLDVWYELLPRTAKDSHVKGELRLRTVVQPLATEGGGGAGAPADDAALDSEGGGRLSVSST